MFRIENNLPAYPVPKDFWSLFDQIEYKASNVVFEASRGAEVQAWDCKRDRFWARFPLEKMKYLIFLIPRSGNNVERGVKFCHSARNDARIGLELSSSFYTFSKYLSIFLS